MTGVPAAVDGIDDFLVVSGGGGNRVVAYGIKTVRGVMRAS
jgi:hypothetical protein